MYDSFFHEYAYFGKTSDARSQHRRGRVGRGVQPPFTIHAPHLHTYTYIHKKHRKRSFSHFFTHATEPTDGRTKPLFRVRNYAKRGVLKF